MKLPIFVFTDTKKTKRSATVLVPKGKWMFDGNMDARFVVVAPFGMKDFSSGEILDLDGATPLLVDIKSEHTSPLTLFLKFT